MAVSTDNAFSGPFLTNGATTQFPFGFTAPGAAEVAVVTYDAAGRRAHVPAAEYAVTLNGGDGGFEAGGHVQFATPPATGLRLFVLLAPAFTQDIAFENGSAWLAEPVNEAYDRAALRDQVLARDMARAPKAQPGTIAPDIGDIADGQALALVDGMIRGVDNDPASAENAATRATRFAQISEAARQRAETAQVEALDAAAIAQGAAAGSLAQGIYPSIAEGIAHVGVGASFYVPDANGDNVLWRNEGGSAVPGGHVAPGVASLRAQITTFASRRFIGRQDVPAAGNADAPAITTVYAAPRPKAGVIVGVEYRGSSGSGTIAPLVARQNPALTAQLNQLRRAAPIATSAGTHETVLFAAIGQTPIAYAAGDYLGFACQAGSIRCTQNTLEDSGPDNGGRWQAAGDVTSLTRDMFINDDSRMEIRLLVDEGDGIETTAAREADATAFLRDGYSGFLPIFLGHGGFRGQSTPARNQASPRQLEQFWRIPVANFSRHGIQTPELEGGEFAGRAIGATMEALTAGKRVITYIQEIYHQLDMNAGLSAEAAFASLQQLCAVLRQASIAGAGASAAKGMAIGVLNLPQPIGAGHYTPARGHAVNMLMDDALDGGTAEFDFIVNLAALPELTQAPPPEGNLWYMADGLHRTTAGERLVAERIRQDTAQWLETAVTARMAALIDRAEGTAAEVNSARETALAAIGLETIEQITAVEDAAITSIAEARSWADSEGLEPGGPGTFSAKEWAREAKQAYGMLFDLSGYYEDTAHLTIDAKNNVVGFQRTSDAAHFGSAPVDGSAAISANFDLKTGRIIIDVSRTSGLVSRFFDLDHWEDTDSITLDANYDVLDYQKPDQPNPEPVESPLLDLNNHPKDHLIGARFIREFPRIRDQILFDGVNSTLHLAFVGDSYTEMRSWLRNQTRAWKTELGDGGPGWCGVGYPSGSPNNINGNVDEEQLSVVPYGTANINGTWMSAEHSPDCCSATSSTAGAGFSFTYVGATDITTAEVFWLGGAGVSRYRWNGGAWTTLNLSGAGGQKAALAAVPTGAWTLDWEVVSGTCVFHGVNFLTGQKGIVVHDLAVSGSSLHAHWSAQIRANPATWRANEAAAIKRLGDIRTFVIPIGTNDQSYNYGYDLYQTAMSLWIDEVGRAATLGADILWVCPPENGRDSTTYPLRMAEFAKRAKTVALTKGIALLDMQPLFGAAYSQYGFNGAHRELITADLLHPNDAGGAVYRQAIRNALTHRN